MSSVSFGKSLIIRLEHCVGNFFKRRKSRAYLFLFFAVIAVSCTDSGEKSAFISFDSNGMQRDTWYEIIPKWSVAEDSALDGKEVWINVRYSPNFPYLNLPLDIEESSLTADTIFSTSILIPLSPPNEGKIGEIKKAVFEKSVKIHDSSDWGKGYKLEFSSPLDSLSGIISIGVILKPAVSPQLH